jgi:Uma2 family endonuclease
MNVAHRYLPHYTYEDYLQWEGRWELIDGIPYAMSPAPIPRHQTVAGNLHAEFRAAIRKAKCSCMVYQPLDYKLSDDTIFNPDVSVVCKPISKKFLDFAPEIVAEILSESTGLKDRNVKYPKYEAEGIPYYIMVDAEKNIVEVYKLVDGQYSQQPLDQSTPFEFKIGDCLFEIVFNDIWE